VLLTVVALGAGARPAAALPDDATLRQWIVAMKESSRGPFTLVRWFCADGSVLPAQAGCAAHGGGSQHGEWSEQVTTLRANGFMIANVLAEVDPARFTGPAPDLPGLEQMLVERFLIDADDGWIFRGVRTYRGGVQAEDEEQGAARLVEAMLDDPRWADDTRFFLLRETVRLLPVATGERAQGLSDVRRRALALAQRDAAFNPLRVKIHGLPDAGDAQRVRDYARTQAPAALQADYARLADDIDALYTARGAADEVRALAALLPAGEGKLAGALGRDAAALAGAKDPGARLAAAAGLAGLLRERSAAWRGAEARHALYEASLALETEAFTAGTTLLLGLDGASRRRRLAWLDQSATALYGAGFITQRHLDHVRGSIKRLTRRTPTLETYRREIAYLARVPEWAGRTMVLDFSEATDRLERIEPLAHRYPQDRLRGSPLALYAAVVDSLVRDANGLAGVQHELFGERIGAGLRALNPGLARGIIRVPGSFDRLEDFDRNGIYLLPETVSDLPPLAGILTQGEGSSVSHVQLLARNLGIPNVVVGDALVDRVRSHAGRPAVLAVSPGGVVQLDADGSRWDDVFGRAAVPATFEIRPDLGKLDLDVTDFVPLGELDAGSSGRIAGPKSANLGELRKRFGPAVPDGFVIPFGTFRRLLERPIEPGGPPVFAWMKERYAAIAALDGRREAQQRELREFLGRLRAWIERVDPGPDFTARLDAALGRLGAPGVFVRSDTNVEDLPGFTGAGLNLTVPNVVGRAAVLDAIRRVWASPFTERAYSWRQAHMDQPEYVFPAVLVQAAFPSQKSGVMVTRDLIEGRDGWLTIAVSEGVGGAVDGQAAESLLVNEHDGTLVYLAQATAPQRRELSPSGGLRTVPASGTDTVLAPKEVAQLVMLAREIPSRFPSLRTRGGKRVPADVEFGFRGGQLALLQIRPLVENAAAQGNRYLAGLDASFRARDRQSVDLDGTP
jgi:rifampicin phosphotransferase